MFFFIVGAILPLISYVIHAKWPNSFIRYVKSVIVSLYIPHLTVTHSFPVIFSGTALLPPATAVNYVSWAMIGFLFQYVIRRRHFSWWTKYNYVLSAALDSGVAIGIVLVFFCLQYPKNGTIGANTIQTWWGNTVFSNTVDFDSKHARLKFVTPENPTFG